MPSILNKVVKQKSFVIGAVLLSPIFFMAIFANFIAPFNPLLYTGAKPLSPPSFSHIMGTDQTGGDIFSQVVYGARVALYVGIGSAALALAIAIVVGLPAGYFGGIIGEVLMRFTDLVISIPSFVLIIMVVVLFGSSINTILLIIALVSWPILARIIRAEVLSLKEREFILAAKAGGISGFNIMFDEILPNVWFRLTPAVTLQAGLAIIIEAGISFLGLGDPNSSSWGRILMFAYQAVFSGAWWGLLFPTLLIIITVVGFNQIGDGLAKAFNPRTTQV